MAVRLAWISAGLAFALSTAAHADDAVNLRRELDELRGKIEQIDAQIADTAHDSDAIKDKTDAYTAKAKAGAATGAALKERSQQLASRLAQLETDHAAAEQTCRKTTATTQEYEAALAQCEKVRQAYQQHAGAYRAEEQRLSADDSAYRGVVQDLRTAYDDIEKKRQDLLARQAALQQSRLVALGRFNELSDRLSASQSSAKQPALNFPTADQGRGPSPPAGPRVER